MKKDTLFLNLLKLIPRKKLTSLIYKYKADHYVKKFDSWEHLKVLIFGQICGLGSLRDIEMAASCRRWRIGKLKRSTLSDANQKRNANLFMDLANCIAAMASKSIKQEAQEVLNILDSSPIQLKGKGYEWTNNSSTLRCHGLKLHVEYETGKIIPKRIKSSYANENDCTVGQTWPIELGKIYVFDKGYCDYNWWWQIEQKKAFFVTRLKKNASIEIVSSNKVEGDGTIIGEEVVLLKNKAPRGHKKNFYEKPLRRIVVARDDKKTPLILVTNLMEYTAEQIALFYKTRWQIELFFKWIKQNLKIKKFIGRSENAVRIQLAVAIITFLLLRLYKQVLPKKIVELSEKQFLLYVRLNMDKKCAFCPSPPFSGRWR